MRWNLSSKLFAGIACAFAVMAAFVAGVTYEQTQAAAMAQQEAVAEVLMYTFETLLSQDSQDSMAALQRVAENSATLPAVNKIAIVDLDGRVLASTRRTEIGGRDADVTSLVEALSTAKGHHVTVDRSEGVAIVRSLRGSHVSRGAVSGVVGLLEITFSRDAIDGAASAAALRLLTRILGGALVPSLVLFFGLRALVTVPMQELAKAARQLRQGERHIRSRIRRGDEIGVLSEAFDEMADEVQAVLEGLEREVAARTAELERKLGELGLAVQERIRTEDALTRARDQAEEANRLKSAFVATMSHELRTPLNAIIGYSEILLEDATDPSMTRDLERIRSSGKQLLALIDDVLDISKIEAGKLAFRAASFEIGPVIEGVVDAIRPIAEAHKNRVEVRCAAGLSAFRSDPLRVRQCLLNLLSNAAKFTQEGSITVAVEADSRGEVKGARFEVRDTGMGISRELMGRLFQEFSQGEPSSTGRFGGTGLGLAITRRLCRLLGGDVEVESEVGKGTTFTMFLPLEMPNRTGAPREG